MAALGPFENTPEIAVAVSGGADSLCLAYLANLWARNRRGRVTGLIVDHGLRPESGREAALVAERLAKFDVSANILAWDDAKPVHGIPAAARTARYGRLRAWCRDHDCLHLLLAHHAADQAETHLMRHRAHSGADGLAGMAAVTEQASLRTLRPLLDVAPERLRATLRGADLEWVEDPTNQDRRYTRTRLRQEIAAQGCGADLVRAARTAAEARIVAERRTARYLVDHVRLFASGHGVLDAAAMAAMPADDARRCLTALVGCIAASAYPPRVAGVERLRAAIVGGGLAGGRTLGGCRFVPRTGDTVLVCREPAAANRTQALVPGQTALWDGRFNVRLSATADAARDYSVRRLDDRAWATLRRRLPEAAMALAAHLGPGMAVVRAGLPALHGLDGPCALPHLPNWRSVDENAEIGAEVRFTATFAPRKPLFGAIFGSLAVDSAVFAGSRSERV